MVRLLRLPSCAVVLTALLLHGSAPVAARTVGDDSVVTTTRMTDPADAEGLLDIVAVGHRVREAGGSARVRFTVRLRHRIKVTSLDRRHRLLVAELDADGRPGSERNITVYGRGSELHADLVSNATRKVIRALRVRLLGGNRIRVSGFRQLVGARKIFWYSYYHRTGDPACGWDDGYRVTCADSVPDDGWLRLPEAAWPARGQPPLLSANRAGDAEAPCALRGAPCALR